jgi:DNA processing protein
MAMEENREVFCIPGSIDNPVAAGPHRLIKDGAKLLQTVEDLLEEFPALGLHSASSVPSRRRRRGAIGPAEPELAAVWELLDWVEPRHYDELASLLQLDIKEVSRRLTLLELGNYIIGDCGAVTRRPPN